MAVKKCTQCGTVKPLSEFYKQKAAPAGVQSRCKVCANIAAAEYRSANADKIREKYAEYYKANAERMRLKAARHRGANKDEVRAAYRAWRIRTKEVRAQKMAEWREKNPGKNLAWSKRWQKNNLDKCRANNARRHAAKLRAVPSWAELDKIKIIYQKARELRLEVDHVVPLQNALVCGLHVWHNLQLLDESENARKKNRHWPDMP